MVLVQTRRNPALFLSLTNKTKHFFPCSPIIFSFPFPLRMFLPLPCFLCLLRLFPFHSSLPVSQFQNKDILFSIMKCCSPLRDVDTNSTLVNKFVFHITYDKHSLYLCIANDKPQVLDKTAVLVNLAIGG